MEDFNIPEHVQNSEEFKQTVEQYQSTVAEVKMHQSMIKASLETIQKSKDAMAELAIKLEATQQRLKDIVEEGKEESNE